MPAKQPWIRAQIRGCLVGNICRTPGDLELCQPVRRQGSTPSRHLDKLSGRVALSLCQASLPPSRPWAGSAANRAYQLCWLDFGESPGRPPRPSGSSLRPFPCLLHSAYPHLEWSDSSHTLSRWLVRLDDPDKSRDRSAASQGLLRWTTSEARPVLGTRPALQSGTFQVLAAERSRPALLQYIPTR
jgi:hypothetical protein